MLQDYSGYDDCFSKTCLIIHYILIGKFGYVCLVGYFCRKDLFNYTI